MKSLVMADNSVGEKIVKWLLQHHKDDLACIVTTSENAIFYAARSAGIPCHVYKDEDRFLSYWHELKEAVDYGFLLWWPHILRPAILDLAINGFINTHPSMLPHNRGKHYNFWAIVEEAPFGVSLHFVQKGIDCGDVVAQERIAYGWEDTGGSLYEKSQVAICELFKKTYPLVRSGKYHRMPQDLEKGSFHWGKELEPASRVELDRTYTAKRLLNLFRARTFEGKPACRFNDGGCEFEVRVNIRRVEKD
jgi:methionyl-tRNA formyltransferase